MKVICKDQVIYISIDTIGNLYLSLLEYDNRCYQININARNELYLDHYDHNITSLDPWPCKPFLVEENNLKKKIETECAEEEEEDDEEEIYIPEEENIYLEAEEYNDDIFDVNEDTINDEYDFDFFANNSNMKVLERDNDIGALYNSYVYEDSKLIFMSRSNTAYIVKLYNDATILFRPIGSREIKYNIIITDNNINILRSS